MRRSIILFALFALATRARAQRPRGSQADTTCLGHVAEVPGWNPVDVPDSLGSLLLPPNPTTDSLGPYAHGRHLILEDSTVVDVWVTPQPPAAMASSGGLRPKSVRNCQTLISGHPAFIARVELGAPGRASVFLGMLNITVDSSHALNLSVMTATASSRDDMLRWLGSVRLRGGRH